MRFRHVARSRGRQRHLRSRLGALSLLRGFGAGLERYVRCLAVVGKYGRRLTVGVAVLLVLAGSEEGSTSCGELVGHLWLIVGVSGLLVGLSLVRVCSFLVSSGLWIQRQLDELDWGRVGWTNRLQTNP